jgi:hypothetical protein
VIYFIGIYAVFTYSIIISIFNPGLFNRRKTLSYIFYSSSSITLLSIIFSFIKKNLFLSITGVVFILPQVLFLLYIRNRKEISFRVKEKRRAKRSNLLLDIKYKREKDEEWKSAVTKDVSISGLRILISESLDKREKISLKIKIPEEQWPLVAEAEVIWVKQVNNEYEIGLKFIKINDADRSKLGLKQVFSSFKK